MLTALGATLIVACAGSPDVDGSGGHPAAGGSNSGGAGGLGSAGAGSPSLPSVSVVDAHPVLDDTHANVRIVLSHASTKPVTVEFSTADGSAQSGQGDYVPTMKTVTFAPGTTLAIVPVAVTSPVKHLTLDTTLDRSFNTALAAPVNATLGDSTGVVTLGHAGMVIEMPVAKQLGDGDVIPDFDGDGRADLVLTGSGGRAALLASKGTTFAEAAHVVVDDAYLDGVRAFSWHVNTGPLWLTDGIVAGDQTMFTDQNSDGLADIFVPAETSFHLLYGRTGALFNFESKDPRLSDGTHGTLLDGLRFEWGSSTVQTGDYDGDGVLDFAQSGHFSTAAGGDERCYVYYGSPGAYPGTHVLKAQASYASGTTAVGIASLTHGTMPGIRVDLNGDGIDDLVFVGLSSNDGQFGGNHLFVKFGTGTRDEGKNIALSSQFDGKNGFMVSNSQYPSNLTSYFPQDGGDVNGDGIDDLVLLGGGVPLTVIFGKSTPFAAPSYATLAHLGPEAAFFDTAKVHSARIGDMNGDGISDIIFVSENKLRIVWGQQGLQGKAIFGTKYPEVGEVDIDESSGLNRVSMVGDLDGDGADDVVIVSSEWQQKTGAALVVFGATLTRTTGGPDIDLTRPK